MIQGDEWKRDVNGPRAERATPAVPSASARKWTDEEVDCIVLAFDACKGAPARFHAEFNDITPGRQRTLAELSLHLPRVAKARGFDVPPKFLADCDAVIDGTVAAVPSPTALTDPLVAEPQAGGEWDDWDNRYLAVIDQILDLETRGLLVWAERKKDEPQAGMPQVWWEGNYDIWPWGEGPIPLVVQAAAAVLTICDRDAMRQARGKKPAASRVPAVSRKP